jgi:hypothetical protein
VARSFRRARSLTATVAARVTAESIMRARRREPTRSRSWWPFDRPTARPARCTHRALADDQNDNEYDRFADDRNDHKPGWRTVA